MSKKLLAILPSKQLKVNFQGDFGNGLTVTGGSIGGANRDGSRWITVFYKGATGTNAKILANGQLDTSACNDLTLPAYIAVYEAAIEQFCGQSRAA